MNRKAKGTAFKMKSGNTTEFKSMGSSPVKAVSPSYYSNLMANLQTQQAPNYMPDTGLTPSAPSAPYIPRPTPTSPSSMTPGKTHSGPDSPVYVPPTGPIGPTPLPIDQLVLRDDPIRTSQTGSTTTSNKPNNQLAEMNLDLESEVLDKIEAPDYDADEGSGSLYDYSVRKKASAITKRLPKGKRGFKMKRK